MTMTTSWACSSSMRTSLSARFSFTMLVTIRSASRMAAR